LGGPKCLRFAAAVQASHKKDKVRKTTSEEVGVVWSAGKLSRRLVIPAEPIPPDIDSSTSGPDTKVSIALHPDENWLLNDDSLQDVEGFAERKKHP
jgi:hypothetical protein